MKTRIPKEGEVVEALDLGGQWKEVTVEWCLSSQFTARDADDKLGYWFYHDHGTTWRKKGTEDKYRFGRSGKC